MGIYEMGQEMHGSQISGQARDHYWLTDGQLVYNFVSFPLTGAFIGAGVHITEFSVQKDARMPRLYHIEMTGMSVVTGHTYSLTTSVYLREDMGER